MSNASALRGLEDTAASRRHRIGQWDQFEANEKLFGVRAEFDEDQYTTKLDKNSEAYKRREKEAERKAREIMNVRITLQAFLFVSY